MGRRPGLQGQGPALMAQLLRKRERERGERLAQLLETLRGARVFLSASKSPSNGRKGGHHKAAREALIPPPTMPKATHMWYLSLDRNSSMTLHPSSMPLIDSKLGCITVIETAAMSANRRKPKVGSRQ